jgi:hypothetical protein
MKPVRPENEVKTCSHELTSSQESVIPDCYPIKVRAHNFILTLVNSLLSLSQGCYEMITGMSGRSRLNTVSGLVSTEIYWRDNSSTSFPIYRSNLQTIQCKDKSR